jgi:hypothetical protein
MASTMNMPPADIGSATATGSLLPGGGRAAFGQASVSALSMKWAALHDAANVVATLAGLAPESMSPAQRTFPATLREAAGWRRELVEQGIDDLAAILEPGISALLAVHARGVHPAAPALVLWQEFVAARDAVMRLAPPAGSLGPLRPM